MKSIALSDLLVSTRAGYWGGDPGQGDIDVRVIRNGDIKPSAGVVWDELPVRSMAKKQADQSRVVLNDLLITTSGDCGVTALVESEPEEMTCSSNFVRVLRADADLVEPRYLFHYSKTPAFREALRPHIRGTTMQNLSTRTAFAALAVPLPRRDEQQRIASILDRAEALRAKRGSALVHLDHIAQSIFWKMFGDVASGDRRWPVELLQSVASTTSGGTPSRGAPGNYGGPIPWIKSGELHSRTVVQSEETLTEQGLVNSSAKLMPPGTVLVAMYGATAGVVSVLGIEAATNQAVCAITPGPRLDTTYLVATLRALNGTLLGRRSGGAQPNLSQKILRGLEIPVPPLSLQQAFAARVGVLETIRARMQSDDYEALVRSLSTRAFSGGL